MPTSVRAACLAAVIAILCITPSAMAQSEQLELPKAVRVEGSVSAVDGLSAYADNGTLVYQQRLLSFGLTETRLFTYRGSRLSEMRMFLDGSLALSCSYLYASDGRLLSIRTAQSEELAGSSPKDASGESSWYRYTESGSTMLAYSRFNGDGRLSTRHVYRLPEGSDQSITLLVEERYAYEDGRLTSMTVLTDAARSERSVQYDTQGRAYREEQKQGGKILSTVERNWDDKGLLLVERSQSKQGIATLTYEYAPDARLVAQRWLQNGIPVRTLLYEAEGITVEELFDNGNLFAKIWKKDGVKVREQIIRNGEVLRERLFP